MNITKLPSGSYRIRHMKNGVSYSLTIDHKPTKTEAYKLIAERVEMHTISADMPFKRACDLYIDSKSNVLSPSSIRGYKSIIKALSPNFMNMRLSSIDLPSVQTEINSYSIGRKPKSVSNMSGFIMGVLKFYGLHLNSPKLPQKEKKEPYIPTPEEVQAIIDEFRGTKYEAAIRLAERGLRRSEICALTIEDLSDDNVLSINKAIVQDSNEKWHVKATKTTESTRQIILQDDLANLIRKQGYIYKGYPSAINTQLHSIQKKLGIEPFSLHKMRHYCVSRLLDKGFSTKQVMSEVGYSTDYVMKSTYNHAMNMAQARKAIADLFS